MTNPPQNLPISTSTSLVDIASLKDNLDALRRELNESDPNTARRLEYVIQQVGKPQASQWFQASLSDFLNVETLERSASQVRPWAANMLNVMEWLRNVLVVAPILFTWYALRVVSDNYTIAIQTNPDLRFDTFLVLGNAVYSGPLADSASFTLSSIAAIDFTILLVIFLMTFFVNFGRDLIENIKKRGALSLRSRLEALLWQVPLSAPAGGAAADTSALLNTTTALLNQQMTANEIVTNLQSQTNRLNTAVVGLEAAAASLQANLQGIQTGIENASRSITDASTRLDQSALTTQTTTQTALTDLRASLAQLNTALGAMQSITPLTQAINQSAQAQTSIAIKVEDVANVITDNQQHLDDMQGKFNQQLLNAQGVLSQVAKDFKSSAQRAGQTGRAASLPLILLSIFSFIQLIILGVIAIAYLIP